MPARFRPRHRLAHNREFTRVFEHNLRASRGPITLHVAPNDLGHPRLGLSIGRRVGNAVRRNRLKRHLREAFRLSMDRLGTEPGLDLVVSARAHEPFTLEKYRQVIESLAAQVRTAEARRARRAGNAER